MGAARPFEYRQNGGATVAEHAPLQADFRPGVKGRWISDQTSRMRELYCFDVGFIELASL
jgi:hypothetical protein